jgi:hypothetical protein
MTTSDQEEQREQGGTFFSHAQAQAKRRSLWHRWFAW